MSPDEKDAKEMQKVPVKAEAKAESKAPKPAKAEAAAKAPEKAAVEPKAESPAGKGAAEGSAASKKADKKAEKKEEAPKVDLERVYTIPLRNATYASRRLRAKKAVAVVRKFLLRHMKAKQVKIGKNLNEHIWARGITKFPPRVKVKASRAGGVVTAERVEQ